MTVTIHDPPQSAKGPTSGLSLVRLQWMQIKARCILFFEMGSHLLLPSLVAASLIVGLSLFGILQQLSSWLHFCAILLAFVCIAGNCLMAVRRWPLPTAAQARRRLEQDSALEHRPVAALADRPARGEANETPPLWDVHRSWAHGIVERLRSPRWRGLQTMDSAICIEGLLAAFLIAAFFNSWGMWGDRLATGLNPLPVWVTPFEDIAFNLEIDSPAYTGLAPIHLVVARTQGQTASIPLRIPAGSVLKGSVVGDDSRPIAYVGREPGVFLTKSKGNYQIAMPLEQSGLLFVRDRFRVLAGWPVEIIPDQPPEIAFTSPPDATPQGILRIAYKASDEYGLGSVTAFVRLTEPDPALSRIYPETSFAISLDLPEPHSKKVDLVAFRDLTGHPWAGRKVTITLSASDGAGHVASTPAFGMTLPQRTFSNEVAATIDGARRDFMHDPDGMRGPLTQLLANLATFPEQYQNDELTMMALRMAADRLTLDHDDTGLYPVSQLIWNTALRIEDRGFSMHEADLREQMDKLAAALDFGAPPSVLSPLVENLRYALNRYLNALAQYMQYQMAQDTDTDTVADHLVSVHDSLIIDRDSLAEKFQRLQDLASTGSMTAARQVLAELQQAIETMDTRPAYMQSAHKGLGPRRSSSGLDPFGRDEGNSMMAHDNGQTAVPGTLATSQSRAILNSLRQRVGATPANTATGLRGYLLRLLDSF